jgi:hypothetical protein
LGNPLTTKDTKYHEGSGPHDFPSCTFVSFVVNELNDANTERYAAGFAKEADPLFEVSAMAVPAANIATANTIRFISRNEN